VAGPPLTGSSPVFHGGANQDVRRSMPGGLRDARGVLECAFEPAPTATMDTNDQRYLIQQNKIAEPGKPPVFAKVMRSKEGKFEGVSFIRNKDKATVMTIAQAEEAVQWAEQKKGNAREYATKIICVGQ
jgi:hypothetical protein